MRHNGRLIAVVMVSAMTLVVATVILRDPSARARPREPVKYIVEITPVADTWYEVDIGTGAPVNATPQGASETLECGWSDVGIDRFALMRFAIPTPRPVHVVTHAEIELGVVNAAVLTIGAPSPVSGTMMLTLLPSRESWDETTLSGLDPPLSGSPAIQTQVVWGPCDPDDCGSARVDVTEYARGWMNGSLRNFGFSVHAGGIHDASPMLGTIYALGSRESGRAAVLRIELVGDDDRPTSTPDTPGAMPDLVIRDTRSDLTWEGRWLGKCWPGDELYSVVNVQIENRGAGTAGRFRVLGEESARAPVIWEVAGMEAGEARWLGEQRGAAHSVVVDADDEVRESDESNNRITRAPTYVMTAPPICTPTPRVTPTTTPTPRVTPTLAPPPVYLPVGETGG